jgi:diketogulonate reductase-like aldo/keto reductase
VSNYNRGQLERMFSGPEAQNFKKKPAVLQNKFDPYHQGDQLNGAVCACFCLFF